MAGLILPSDPGPRVMTPRPISARGEMKPASSGPVTRVLRPGTRWAWDIEMPAMTYPESLAWDDLLSEDETVVMDILQPDLVIGELGLPRINGVGQAGRLLLLDEVEPGYVLRKGQWLSVPVDGQIYAYKSSAAAVAAGNGTMVVPLRTMLRRAPVDSALVEIAAPKAEGYASVDPESLKIDADDRMVRLRFTLEERN